MVLYEQTVYRRRNKKVIARVSNDGITYIVKNNMQVVLYKNKDVNSAIAYVNKN